MYLDYEKYKSYGGNLSDAEFDRFQFMAEREIDNATQSRCKKLAKVPEEVTRCAYELIVYLSNCLKNGSISAVSSVSNDGYSISFTDKKSATEQIYDIIYRYLSDTGLMYCGVN